MAFFQYDSIFSSTEISNDNEENCNTLSLAASYHFRVASPNQYVQKNKKKPMLIAASVLAGICLIAGIGYWLLS